MTMQKVRVNALKRNKFAIMAGDKRLTRRKDRITSAINSNWTTKELPEYARELIIERACLRVEIAVIIQKEQGNIRCDSSVKIANKLKRIDSITQKLNNRK
ncbi:hypothetical protein [Raoultella terrigena]|uniref:hypothetical protein n=1 Tax=Raoultella terrigena TaxID=577 RepID=UPI0005F7FBB0|nr:hypothetical protein [Raoultella terrigena]